jgi:hypothetical protein
MLLFKSVQYGQDLPEPHQQKRGGCMSIFSNLPGLRGRKRPESIKGRNGTIYRYRRDSDRYVSDGGSVLDYNLINLALAGNSSDHTFAVSPQTHTPAADFGGSNDSSGGGDGGGGGGGDGGGGGGGGGGD